jgi:ribonucleoside-diphosphate reductase alpha chain
MSEPAKPLTAERRRLPNRREHEVLDFEHGGFRYIGGIGRFQDGRLAEVFLNVAKSGTAIENHARDAAIVASVALQYGTPVDVIRHALTRNGDGSASGALGRLLDLLASETS